MAPVLVPIFQIAPVPNIFKLGTGAKFWTALVLRRYQIGTGANFLNVTGAGANFSNGTGAKHFQTLAPVPIFYMAPMPQLLKLGTSTSLSNGTSIVALVWTIFRDWGCVHWCKIDFLLKTRRLIRPCRSYGHKSRAIFCSIDCYMTCFMDMAPVGLPAQNFFGEPNLCLKASNSGLFMFGTLFLKAENDQIC